jgi:tetratricopeptide (TPR) repeat protein
MTTVQRWLPLLLCALATGVLAAPPGELCLSDARGLKAADARLFDGIGSYRAPKVSNDPQAQRYFEQAMVFGWGFNFPEATRSFRAAVMRDPDCALCRWGIAWSLGPNINDDMDAAEAPVVRDALVQAQAYARSARDRDLIDALVLRHPSSSTTVSSADARRYSEAMSALAERRPEDADMAVLAAEALMTEHAYDWWRADGTPQPWTTRIEALLERAVRLSPDHPGAHHYRIHVYGESKTPGRAMDSAGRMAAVAPGVGHLVHMPAHIYIRVGRYHEAVRANAAAIEADRRYASLTEPDPQYVAGYVVHNQHFLWAAALWSGESVLATATADAVAAAAAASRRVDDGTRQHLLALPWLTDVRFARWGAVLARPVPTQGAYLIGLASFSRGVAAVRTGDVRLAQRELAALQSARRTAATQKLTIKNVNRAGDVLALAESWLKAEIAVARRAWPEARRRALQAVKSERALADDEPQVWPLPAEQLLGHVELAADAPQAALSAFRRDLDAHPENAYALVGTAAAQRRLGEAALADRTLADARRAWSHADIPLPAP